MMKLTETYTSLTQTHIKFDIYQPNVILRYKGIIQLHHGLCEHSDRYQKFAEYLSHEGFIVVVPDFPGHDTSPVSYTHLSLVDWLRQFTDGTVYEQDLRGWLGRVLFSGEEMCIRDSKYSGSLDYMEQVLLNQSVYHLCKCI